MAFSASAAVAAPAPPLPPLAGTTVTWRGHAGIVLRVPDPTTLPDHGAHVTVTGGTYAVARWVQPCERDVRLRCNMGGINYLRELAAHYDAATRADGRDHLASAQPLSAGVLELYLFTDGIASIRFDGAGRRTVPARGRVSGSFAKLRLTSGDNGVWYAGTSRTVTHGSADVAAASWEPASVTMPTLRTARSCTVASARGCPDAPADVAWETAALDTTTLVVQQHYFYGRGVVPLGGRIKTAFTHPGDGMAVWVVAVNYGIR